MVSHRSTVVSEPAVASHRRVGVTRTCQRHSAALRHRTRCAERCHGESRSICRRTHTETGGFVLVWLLENQFLSALFILVNNMVHEKLQFRNLCCTGVTWASNTHTHTEPVLCLQLIASLQHFKFRQVQLLKLWRRTENTSNSAKKKKKTKIPPWGLVTQSGRVQTRPTVFPSDWITPCSTHSSS